MDVAALILAILAFVFFLIPELTRWAWPALTLMFIAQWTTVTDTLVNF